MKPASSSLKLHSRFAILTLLIGVVLMAGKIYFDSEPGLIPLLLVGSGIGWYFLARLRRRAEPVQ